MHVRRLKTREQFQAVLAGATVARTEHFVMHRIDLDTPVAGSAPVDKTSTIFGYESVWLGAMVPKRWARRAATRNLIKRQIYSVAVRYAAALPRAGHLIRLRSGFDRLSFKSAASDLLRAAVRSEIEQLFSKALQAQVPA